MDKTLRILALALVLTTARAEAQTASSMFWRKDSVQVTEIISPEAVIYNKVGHHGPAVENVASAFRLYFNDSGAIDTYSKSGKQMELLKYRWYPKPAQREDEGAGCDEYAVSKTIGLGGIALWDGEKELPLVATEGRTGRVGKSKDGSWCEIVAHGVEYKGGKVDISIRIDVQDGSRLARVTACELGGRKVQFVTGINFHEGQDIMMCKGKLSAWGVHPPDVSKAPIPVGSALWYKPCMFGKPEKTAKVMRIISKPRKSISTLIMASSTKEAADGMLAPGVPALGSQESFNRFVAATKY